jgi:hypothetical protein
VAKISSLIAEWRCKLDGLVMLWESVPYVAQHGTNTIAKSLASSVQR